MIAQFFIWPTIFFVEWVLFSISLWPRFYLSSEIQFVSLRTWGFNSFLLELDFICRGDFTLILSKLDLTEWISLVNLLDLSSSRRRDLSSSIPWILALFVERPSYLLWACFYEPRHIIQRGEFGNELSDPLQLASPSARQPVILSACQHAGSVLIWLQVGIFSNHNTLLLKLPYGRKR